jgi:glycerophosphoryl diester phosphodiesterase
MGIQNNIVNQMHAEGRFCFVWTLDDLRFMRDFIEQGNFDGILTNYPTILSYYHYVYHNND